MGVGEGEESGNGYEGRGMERQINVGESIIMD